MKTVARSLRRRKNPDDEAVSPVIAVILMVAITVVLAATVYIWVTSFSGSQSKPVVAAISVATYDNDTDNKADGIRVTLSESAQAIPWTQVQITRNGTVMGSVSINGALAVYENHQARQDNTTIKVLGSTSTSSGDWANGDSLYMRCDTVGSGNPAVNQEIVVTIRGTVVHTQRVLCEETGV